MAKRRNKNNLESWSKVFIITLLIVFIIKSFLFDSFKISTSQMESSLLKGDYVIVNKFIYGVKIPTTLLSFPFVFDSLLGRKSYSSLLQLEYKRIFEQKIKNNDIVLYNNLLEKDKPIDKRTLCIARCVASCGEIVDLRSENFYIDGKYYPPPFDFQTEYFTGLNEKHIVDSIMQSLQIVGRNITQDTTYYRFTLSRYEAILINRQLDESLKIKKSNTNTLNCQFVIPFEGLTIKLNENNINLYKSIILNETSTISVVGNKLYIAGKILESYTFIDDYYWLISDNVAELTDSRSMGFISEKYVVGKVTSIYFSKSNYNIRWNRLFKSVK